MTNKVEDIRIGFIGAGANTRLRHIPGFKAMDGVKLISVSNRSLESSQRIATEHNIPVVYSNWRELVDAEDTNAICIGTWPNMHCTLVLAALENDKHVLTEARMATDATEAHIMLEASKQNPHLVTQIVTGPMTLKIEATVQDMIAQGYLGRPLAINMRINQNNFIDTEGPHHWRHDRDSSGYNILQMGIWYECLMRLVGPATRVTAMTKVGVSQRLDDAGYLHPISVPDHVDIICEMACGAQANLSFSAITGLASSGEIWLHGSEGTLKIETSGMKLFGGRKGDQVLSEIQITAEKEGLWRVEEEFINAIRGKEKVTHTNFEDGVKYMEFTEAVTRSAQEGKSISLPL